MFCGVICGRYTCISACDGSATFHLTIVVQHTNHHRLPIFREVQKRRPQNLSRVSVITLILPHERPIYHYRWQRGGRVVVVEVATAQHPEREDLLPIETYGACLNAHLAVAHIRDALAVVTEREQEPKRIAQRHLNH
jgi:hypothetical protein